MRTQIGGRRSSYRLKIIYFLINLSDEVILFRFFFIFLIAEQTTAAAYTYIVCVCT